MFHVETDRTDRTEPGDDADREHASAAYAMGEVVLEATRGLLWIKAPGDARLLARALITRLGGSTVLAREADADALPVDVSFGAGEPELPVAPPASVALMQLERYLPLFVEDAHRAVELASETDRFAQDAAIDVLTGLANRRSLGRMLGRLRADDTVIMLDLDLFKQVNDTHGHEAGDQVLHSLGRTLAQEVRGRDRVGRYGGEEFVIVLADGDDAGHFLSRLRRAWESARPWPITFSAGVAPAAPNPATALVAADRAMYRAKQAGRDQWVQAEREDYRS
jgi:diguanylate cyclase (GGDEF)-like protein